MRKKSIFTLSLIVILTMLFALLPVAESDIEPLDEKTFKNLYDQFWRASVPLYDVSGSQNIVGIVGFKCDSKGVPYANGKTFYYFEYNNTEHYEKYFGEDIRNFVLEDYKKCLTPELAARMVEDIHVPGGPDVELVRRGANGNWYRLRLVCPDVLLRGESIDIKSDGKTASVKFKSTVAVIKASAPYEGSPDYFDGTYTADLVYTDDGWRISGGDIFDYIRNYAATSPETGDEKGERAVMFAAGAVVAVAVPAAILTLTRKRRKDRERDD